MANKLATMKIPESLYSWANEKNIGSEQWKNRKRFIEQCEANQKMVDFLLKLLKSEFYIPSESALRDEAEQILREAGAIRAD